MPSPVKIPGAKGGRTKKTRKTKKKKKAVSINRNYHNPDKRLMSSGGIHWRTNNYGNTKAKVSVPSHHPKVGLKKLTIGKNWDRHYDLQYLPKLCGERAKND